MYPKIPCTLEGMEIKLQSNKAVQYDRFVAGQFYNSIVRSKLLPKRYAPKGFINRTIFADAMIGLYLDSLEGDRAENPDKYNVGLTRAAFAIDFLEGIEADELQPRVDELTALGECIDDQREYAFSIAVDAVRHLIEREAIEGPPEESTNSLREIDKKEASVDQYEDITDLIYRLHEENRLPGDQARVLLVLLRQVPSPLSLAQQAEIIDGILPYIKTRLFHTLATQPYKRDETLQDEQLACGAEYVKQILAHPGSVLASSQLFRNFIQMEMLKDDSLSVEAASKRVKGHIGYTLDVMYRENLEPRISKRQPSERAL